MIGLFPDLLSKKMQEKQKYPPEILDARKYMSSKDLETGVNIEGMVGGGGRTKSRK